MPSACNDRTELVRTIECLVERLNHPDLTLAEANDLRPRLFLLLETIGGTTSTDPSVDPMV
jgi:hypothetical protein